MVGDRVVYSMTDALVVRLLEDRGRSWMTGHQRALLACALQLRIVP